MTAGPPGLAPLSNTELESLLRTETHAYDAVAPTRPEYLAGKRVLVAGAGGSIGGELSRQIAAFGAAKLVLVDRSETGLFEIEHELLRRGCPAVVPTLADVGDSVRMSELFAEHRPELVFHAAGYKHVPLIEVNPLESVRNNVFATKVVADSAAKAGVEAFVLLSTDKAANPTTVLGQSKALCERIVEAYGRRAESHTRFIAVRFGNVIDSSGSVLHVFLRQIAGGGPVTVTDPHMSRYFVTRVDTAALIIEAGRLGLAGEIYLLDPGRPIKVVDLATRLIRRYTPDPEAQIEIRFVGARRAEKVHEELAGPGERLVATMNSRITRIARDFPDATHLERQLEELEQLLAHRDTRSVLTRLSELVEEPAESGAGAPAS